MKELLNVCQMLLLQFSQMAEVCAVKWGLETGEVYWVMTVSLLHWPAFLLKLVSFIFILYVQGESICKLECACTYLYYMYKRVYLYEYIYVYAYISIGRRRL